MHFDPLPLNQLADEPHSRAEWLWDGYVARGNITLLTSVWKAGKTTLVAGLLRALGSSPAFLARPCAAAHAVVVSEESQAMWVARQRAIPVGPHAMLSSRPFATRPTPAQWDELVTHAEILRTVGKLDLFVVDPLAAFLPGRTDSDAGTLLDMLQPLRRLADSGAAVLILHHPRKKPADEGSAARGSGALLAFVDVVLELHRYGRLASDANRRRLTALSRHTETPPEIVYEWVPDTAEFRTVSDAFGTRFRENWDAVRAILAARDVPATHKELLADWPAERVAPSAPQLYEWLARAVAEKLAERIGNGTRSDPFRFRLPPVNPPGWTELPTLRPLR